MWVISHARFEGGPVLRVDTNSVTIQPPPGASITVEFDGETNPLLMTDLLANMVQYTIAGGQLWKGGRAAPINPPGIAASDLKLRPVIVEKLRADQELTDAEVRVALRYLIGAYGN